MAMRIGAFVGILILWINDRRKETTEELISILKLDFEASNGQTLFI